MLDDARRDSAAPGASPKRYGDLVAVSEVLPQNLLLLPVSHTTLFPGMAVPLILPEGKLSKTIEYVLEGSGYVGVIVSRNSDDPGLASGPATSITGLPADSSTLDRPTDEETQKRGAFLQYGIAAKVLKKINLPDNQISVLLTGLQRFELKKLVSQDPYFVGNVDYLYDETVQGTELEALLRSALSQFKTLSKDNPLISEEVKVALVNIDGPARLADFMASVLIREVSEYQKLLASVDVRERLHQLLSLLKKEQDVQNVQRKIQDDINQKISAAQREFYLHEQLKSIQKELGRAADEKSRMIQKFRDRLEGKTLSEEVRTRIDEEFDRITALHEQSSEFSVAIGYLDWVTALPWGVHSEEKLGLGEAKRVLDEEHFGLKEVKQRILEFLAVKKLKPGSEGSILCLVGPPGTGKTSLGRSIARVLNRKFFRFSVGGMRDEAEIKGHRRTYVGAMPGKVIQGLKRVGTDNPVFLIDEIDKMATGWSSGGDPAAALLELLDPEQNPEFLDHYLDLPFDCSKVLFVTTANTLDTIPPALLDRMEVIPLHGYTDAEKLNIARRHLIPKQLGKHALRPSQLKLNDAALLNIVERYAREAGVRNLEKQIAKICRKAAFRIAARGARDVSVRSAQDVEKILGMPPFSPDMLPKERVPGVATGLAWTQYGGEILFVESRLVPGRGGLMLTGTLGKVMQESANIAYTLIRERSDHLGLPRGYFDKHVLHLHVPAGSTPKDGPSAGVTIAVSLYSLLTGKVADPEVAMTGEITLTGRVLPVGGIKEKLLAAKRSKVRTVLIPKDNARDLKEIDAEVKKGLKILKIGTLDQALRHMF